MKVIGLKTPLITIKLVVIFSTADLLLKKPGLFLRVISVIETTCQFTFFGILLALFPRSNRVTNEALIAETAV